MLSVVELRRDGWWVVVASGELDVASAPDLRRAVVSAVADGARQVVIDLTGVDFIDSFGLGVVIGAVKRVRAHEGRLAVVVADGPVRRAFELTGLDRVLELRAGVDEVVAGPA